MKPSVGRIVHYVSYGTPGGEYGKECRAAVITGVHDGDPVPEHGMPYVDLFVMNPTGVFLNQSCRYDDGAGRPASPDCPNPHEDGPMRYCQCGWTEPTLIGGTWHWPEQVAS